MLDSTKTVINFGSKGKSELPWVVRGISCCVWGFLRTVSSANKFVIGNKFLPCNFAC